MGEKEEASGDIKTFEDIDVEDEDEMKTGRRKRLLEMLERAKKETTHYRTAYEGIEKKKEAKLKEKEEIMVSIGHFAYLR